MYKYSIAPSEFLAPNFESKLAMCDRLSFGYVEIDDVVNGEQLHLMSGDKIEDMRNLLIDYGKTISLLTYSGKSDDTERFKKLLRNAHMLGVKCIKAVCESDIECSARQLSQLSDFSSAYGIKLCVENMADTKLCHDKDIEKLIGNSKISTIFNPMQYAFLRSHPFFHEFYSSKLKNTVEFLRVNDGLFIEKKPTLPGHGNAEIKELTSILLSRSFDGYFSFEDCKKNMCWADLLEYVTSFKTLLKSM